MVVNEKKFWNSRQTCLEGSRLHPIGGCGLLQEGAKPSFFPDSKSSKIELSIDVIFDFELFWKGAKNFKNVRRGTNIGIWRTL